MNRFRSFILILVVLIAGLYGCDLLGNQKPQQSVTSGGNLNSVSDLQTVLTGAYNDLQARKGAATFNGDSFGEEFFSFDILAEDAVFTGSFPSFQQIANRDMVNTNTSIQNIWNGSYIDINDANIILSQLGKIENSQASQATMDNLRGQALFIRAVNYFYLVNLFALPSGATPDDSQLGVPLQLKAVTSQSDFRKPSRSPVDSVYIQITSDLQTAEGLLSPDNLANQATPGAATALLMRVALIRSNFQRAADLAGQIIDSENYSLLSDVTAFFTNELSSEAIFSIENTPQDTPDAGNTNVSSVYNIGQRDDIQINTSFANALDAILNSRQQAAISASGATAVDTRNSNLIVGKNDNGNIITFPSRDQYQGSTGSNSSKYEDRVNAADNIPIIRYPEVILTRAEALARLNGINQESIDLLNQIRERAFTVTGGPVSLVDYTAADFSSKQDLINAVLLERRVELAFEGLRTIDLQRIKEDVRGLPFDDPTIVFPIPLQQLNNNKNIEQNPGYGGGSGS